MNISSMLDQSCMHFPFAAQDQNIVDMLALSKWLHLFTHTG